MFTNIYTRVTTNTFKDFSVFERVTTSNHEQPYTLIYLYDIVIYIKIMVVTRGWIVVIRAIFLLLFWLLV